MITSKVAPAAAPAGARPHATAGAVDEQERGALALDPYATSTAPTCTFAWRRNLLRVAARLEEVEDVIQPLAQHVRRQRSAPSRPPRNGVPLKYVRSAP